jgi:hypothetical protein
MDSIGINWEQDQAEFEEHIIVDGEHIVWKNSHQYRTLLGKEQPVARISFQLYSRQLLKNSERVWRTCDKKKCIKFEHLEIRGIQTMIDTPSDGHWDNLERKLKSKVEIDNEGHWVWIGKRKYGYGTTVSFWNKNYHPHILAFMTKKRTFVEKGFQVRHLCKKRYCINPDHLDIGTAKQNAEDKIIHGTNPEGEKNPSSKLVNKQVLEIFNSKETHAKLAKDFDVSKGTIGQIKYGLGWNHITGKEKIENKPKKKHRTEFNPHKAPEKLAKVKSRCDLEEDENGLHWLWKGCLNNGGYGVTIFNGSTTFTHRVTWICSNKRMIDNNKIIRHKCLFML